MMMDNKREVLRFWLGFLEKIILIVLVSVLLPLFIGKLDIPFFATWGWGLICLTLLLLVVLLSW